MRTTSAQAKGRRFEEVGLVGSANLHLEPELASQLVSAAQSRSPVSLGARRTASPHEFYRYPARFSPELARAAILSFSQPGELVIDPFVGGGTSTVEAMLAGRRSVSSDINSLATFVTRVKVTPLTARQCDDVKAWADGAPTRLKLNRPAPDVSQWDSEGYFRHLTTPSTWRLSKAIALALESLEGLEPAVERFCRCVVLRTAQWALDMRQSLPSVDEFRTVLRNNGVQMADVAADFSRNLPDSPSKPIIVDVGVPGLAFRLKGTGLPPPALILTSPPYPGVYVNYHRWKLRGRKEVRAAYWIAASRDGHGLAHYTMSARADPTLDSYFSKLEAAFHDIARFAGPSTVVMQVVGFNDPDHQLPRYLQVMARAGFTELTSPLLATRSDGRLWREVPGRRWWTAARTKRDVAPHTAREVVLFHSPTTRLRLFDVQVANRFQYREQDGS